MKWGITNCSPGQVILSIDPLNDLHIEREVSWILHQILHECHSESSFSITRGFSTVLINQTISVIICNHRERECKGGGDSSDLERIRRARRNTLAIVMALPVCNPLQRTFILASNS